MSMITGARTWVDLPAPEPLGGGVVSVATVINASGHELMGVEALTDACSTAEEWAEWCTVTPVGRKIFEDSGEYVWGDPFAIYAGIACDLQTLPGAEARAKARLDGAESRAIDLHIDQMLATSTEVVDLGGPFPINQGIGAAEAFAATVYGGRPTVLIPRLMLECAWGALESSPGGTLTTKAGSLVAPITTAVNVPVTVTTETIYVTGKVVIYRGPVNSYSVPQQVFDNGTFAPMRALAERVIVPIFDCLVAKVEVTCS